MALQIYWRRIIKEYKEYKKEKENHLKIIEVSAKDQSIPDKNHSFSEDYTIKDYSISSNSPKDSIFTKDQSIPDKNHSISEDYSIKDYPISSNSPKDSIFTKDHSITAEDHSIPTNDHFISAKNHSKISYKSTNFSNFCYDILQKLDEQSNIHPFYKYAKNKKIQIKL
ncbi:unnamed protein product [Rhizophagus irregularis]|nr:unnamed protein product [Rhizophagus irregularis]